MTSETVYSVELVSRMTYLSANSLRGTYTGTLRRNVPSISVTTRECPFSVPLLNGLVVLDQWERVVEMVEECAPFLVLLGLSESDRVVV